jgi:hypothetical protein
VAHAARLPISLCGIKADNDIKSQPAFEQGGEITLHSRLWPGVANHRPSI